MIVQIESREALDDLGRDLPRARHRRGVHRARTWPRAWATAAAPARPEVQAEIARAIATACAAGCAIGILAADGKAEHYFAQGATLVGVGTDLHMLVAAADALVARFREGLSAVGRCFAGRRRERSPGLPPVVPRFGADGARKPPGTLGSTR